MARTASDVIWSTLRQLGADCVFGLPGSQTAGLFQALDGSGLRTIVPTHELAGSFMAAGYARASGRPGILSTIPGPGFTYALTGLAEARLDSAPLVFIVPAAETSAEREHLLQAIDQRGMVSSVVKHIVRLECPDHAAEATAEAYRTAMSGEPGPVMLEIGPGVMTKPARITAVAPQPALDVVERDVDELVRRLDGAHRVVLYLGAGAHDAADAVRSLAERLGAAVVTTTSGRGVIPEDHASIVIRDPGVCSGRVLNATIARADIVVALGCKFSHNGAAGFGLKIDPARLVSINAAGPSRNYPADLHLTADVGCVVSRVLSRLARRSDAGGWQPADIARLRREAGAPDTNALPEPRLRESGAPVADLIRDLERALPPDAIVVTDSGLHQMCVRRHLCVRSPRGLIVPTNFQSMGFALPAAIGAALAAPQRRVVAVVGDGGLMMSALELSTAVRERVDLTVVLFNDDAYGLIRQAQLADFGTAHGTELVHPDFEALTAALGARFTSCHPDGLAAAMERGRTPKTAGVRVVEVGLGDAPAMRRVRALGTARRVARRMMPADGRRTIQRLLGRA